jgi:hypothetical protein
LFSAELDILDKLGIFVDSTSLLFTLVSINKDARVFFSNFGGFALFGIETILCKNKLGFSIKSPSAENPGIEAISILFT